MRRRTSASRLRPEWSEAAPAPERRWRILPEKRAPSSSGWPLAESLDRLLRLGAAGSRPQLLRHRLGDPRDLCLAQRSARRLSQMQRRSRRRRQGVDQSLHRESQKIPGTQTQPSIGKFILQNLEQTFSSIVVEGEALVAISRAGPVPQVDQWLSRAGRRLATPSCQYVGYSLFV